MIYIKINQQSPGTIRHVGTLQQQLREQKNSRHELSVRAQITCTCPGRRSVCGTCISFFGLRIETVFCLSLEIRIKKSQNQFQQKYSQTTVGSKPNTVSNNELIRLFSTKQRCPWEQEELATESGNQMEQQTKIVQFSKSKPCLDAHQN